MDEGQQVYNLHTHIHILVWVELYTLIGAIAKCVCVCVFLNCVGFRAISFVKL